MLSALEVKNIAIWVNPAFENLPFEKNCRRSPTI